MGACYPESRRGSGPAGRSGPVGPVAPARPVGPHGGPPSPWRFVPILRRRAFRRRGSERSSIRRLAAVIEPASNRQAWSASRFGLAGSRASLARASTSFARRSACSASFEPAAGDGGLNHPQTAVSKLGIVEPVEGLSRAGRVGRPVPGRSGPLGPARAFAGPVGSGRNAPGILASMLTFTNIVLGPVGSNIVAPFPLAGEQGGEPLALLGAQARHEIGEGVGGRFVRGFRVVSATGSATSGRARRNF